MNETKNSTRINFHQKIYEFHQNKLHGYFLAALWNTADKSPVTNLERNSQQNIHVIFLCKQISLHDGQSTDYSLTGLYCSAVAYAFTAPSKSPAATNAAAKLM